MSARLSEVERIIEQLRKFRKNMGATLLDSDIKKIWGDGYRSNASPTEGVLNEVVHEKFKIAQDFTSRLAIPYVVKYIGVSGSVAAGTAIESDDIDIFIVLNNFTSWIYRPLMKLRLGANVVWYGEKNQKDKLCLNYIIEERGLKLSNHDLFVFHELFYLKHLYKPDYWARIVDKNISWLHNEFHITQHKVKPIGIIEKVISVVISIIAFLPDTTLFLVMIIYMYVRRHKPNLSRLITGYIKGVTEFYPEGFREEKLRDVYIEESHSNY